MEPRVDVHDERIKRQLWKVAANRILVINKEKKSSLVIFILVCKVHRKYFVTGGQMKKHIDQRGWETCQSPAWTRK